MRSESQCKQANYVYICVCVCVYTELWENPTWMTTWDQVADKNNVVAYRWANKVRDGKLHAQQQQQQQEEQEECEEQEEPTNG